MNIIVNALGKILMYNETATPTPDPGSSLVTLDDKQTTAFHEANSRPNNGLTWSGDNFDALPPLPTAPPAVRTPREKLEAALGITVAELRAELARP